MPIGQLLVGPHKIPGQKVIDEPRLKLQKSHQLHQKTVNELDSLKAEYKVQLTDKSLLIEEKQRKAFETELLKSKMLVPENHDDFERRWRHQGTLGIALVAGEAAHNFESMPPTDAVTQVFRILKGVYEPQGIDVPEPIQTSACRMGPDPFSLGSYSNVAVGASGDDYDILVENVGEGRIFFTVEATTRLCPATMHGAFLSGLREVANMAYYATVKALKQKVEKSPSKNAHSCASLLADLFREPDFEFGSFSVIFGSNAADSPPTIVLRVTFSGP
ncbi:Protein FLOWERING LOCUS D [Camellia lanceoleosa]|uniref:Protein FLOWERING LOCUS D n=1 Tax=Camellia lanceoleosa TaxID=1840588 RepID=A0ACC0FRR6_9ERIC|nr:Protein FLOWERING LOCUS D [Camellia lanceoleosa]